MLGPTSLYHDAYVMNKYFLWMRGYSEELIKSMSFNELESEVKSLKYLFDEKWWHPYPFFYKYEVISDE